MPFVFEDYVLDLDRRELARGSKAIATGPQVFDLLVYLVQNREHVVSKGFRFVGEVSEVESPDGFHSLKPEPVPSNEAPVLALALPDKASIAVLPFLNLSGDPEQ